MKVVRLSALRTGRLYLPENIPGTHFCYRPSRPQGRSAGEGLCQWKILKTLWDPKPRPFGLPAQCPSELRHRVPLQFTYTAYMHNVVSHLKLKLYPIYCCSLLGIIHWT